MDSTHHILNFTEEQIIEYLKKFRLFEHLSEETLLQLIPLSQIETFSENAVILKEGQENTKVFLLVKGTVGISTHGESILDLRRKGDVFGEMSVISGKASMATVIAHTPVEVFSVHARNIGKYTDGPTANLQANLYRIFAMSLTDKLTITTEKAERFEATSHELQKAKEDLEQHNSTLLAGNERLEELIRTQDLLLAQLGTLHATHLGVIKEILDDFDHHLPTADRNKAHTALEELHQIECILQPVSELYESQQALKKKRVILAEKDKKLKAIAKMALGGTGVILDLAETYEEGKAMIEEQTYDILCADEDFIDLIRAAHDSHPPIDTVFMTSNETSTYINQLKENPFIRNVVSYSEEDKTFTLKDILTTVSKLVTKDIFGLEKYLNWGVEIHESAITGSIERESIISSMEETLKTLGMRHKVISHCSRVAEELLMNTIYDAPVDSEGNSLYNHLSRTVDVELRPEQQGKFRYACDGTMLAISVEDPFGRLDRKTILDYLSHCYSPQNTMINTEKGGAGLGLFEIMETTDLLVINVKPAIKTEVVAIFNVAPHKPKGGKAFSFHYFCDD